MAIAKAATHIIESQQWHTSQTPVLRKPKTDANGTTAQVIKTDQGTLLIDEGNGGLFSSEQLTVSLNDDGTGVLVAKLDKQTSFTVYGSNNDKGSHVGPEVRFDINGDGSGTWHKGNTTVTIHKNGSATLHDDHGLLTIKPDGSGTWQRRGGNAEYIENFGDGTGLLGSINPIIVKMAPWQVPLAATAMPPIQKRPKPTASCGYIINLAENILFDYDKHELNPAAYPLLDELAQALQQTKVEHIEIAGHRQQRQRRLQSAPIPSTRSSRFTSLTTTPQCQPRHSPRLWRSTTCRTE